MNERVYALLKELEWSGTLIGKRTLAVGCPCCNQPRAEWWNGYLTIAAGHELTCELAALLAAENGGLQDVNAELLDAVQKMLAFVKVLRAIMQAYNKSHLDLNASGALENIEVMIVLARAAIAKAEKK